MALLMNGNKGSAFTIQDAGIIALSSIVFPVFTNSVIVSLAIVTALFYPIQKG